MPTVLPPKSEFDPDDVRMAFGEHLEELRGRLIRAVAGLVLAIAVCLIFVRTYVLPFFCRPLLEVLKSNELNPQLFFTGILDPFMVYVKVSIICGAVIAGPYVMWQFWQFIAAGLYSNERKTVTRYIPLSIGLMIAGVALVYTLVLPFTLSFLLQFSMAIPMPAEQLNVITATTNPADMPIVIPHYQGDPSTAPEFGMWYDTSSQRLKMLIHGEPRSIVLGAQNLVAPIITLPEYVNTVFVLLLVFALAFQMPLVVLALTVVNVVQTDELRASRRMIYFGLVVAACIITPGDAITATITLLGPLVLLFEFGLWLSDRQAARTLVQE